MIQTVENNHLHSKTTEERRNKLVGVRLY